MCRAISTKTNTILSRLAAHVTQTIYACPQGEKLLATVDSIGVFW